MGEFVQTECLERTNMDTVMKELQNKMDLYNHFIDSGQRNGKWIIGKWYGDVTIYSRCSVCGFEHTAYRNNYCRNDGVAHVKYDKEKEYNFCPMRGTKMLNDEMYVPIGLIKNILGQINATKYLYICRNEDGTLLAFSKPPIKGYDGKWKIQINSALETNKNYGGIEIPKCIHLFDNISSEEVSEIDVSFIVDNK